MSLRPILIFGDPRLRQVAAPVRAVDAETRALVADMLETMYAAPGRGLAAPQVGVPKRVVVMDCGWKDGAERAPLVLVDPRVLDATDEFLVRDEGCLSIPGLALPIARPAEVTVAWTGLDGDPQERRFSGIEAACVQHEIDHLDGILTVDRTPPEKRAEIEWALAALEEAQG